MIMSTTLKYLILLNSKHAEPLHTCYNYESMVCVYVYVIRANSSGAWSIERLRVSFSH